jgi:hypothetical protein
MPVTDDIEASKKKFEEEWHRLDQRSEPPTGWEIDILERALSGIKIFPRAAVLTLREIGNPLPTGRGVERLPLTEKEGRAALKRIHNAYIDKVQ